MIETKYYCDIVILTRSDQL